METTYKTPYEKYIRENIDTERSNLDELYNEFAKANPVQKQVLKRRIDEALQNIDLLKSELQKYGAGLSWLREPSKNRDDKASHLEKIQEEKPAPAAPARPTAATTTRPMVGTPVGRPQVGAPVGTAPKVGTPVGTTRPQIGSPVGAPKPVGTTQAAKAETPPDQAEAKPQVGTPISARPRIGTPIGAKAAKPTDNEKKEGSNA